MRVEFGNRFHNGVPLLEITETDHNDHGAFLRLAHALDRAGVEHELFNAPGASRMVVKPQRAWTPPKERRDEK